MLVKPRLYTQDPQCSRHLWGPPQMADLSEVPQSLSLPGPGCTKRAPRRLSPTLSWDPTGLNIQKQREAFDTVSLSLPG